MKVCLDEPEPDGLEMAPPPKFDLFGRDRLRSEPWGNASRSRPGSRFSFCNPNDMADKPWGYETRLCPGPRFSQEPDTPTRTISKSVGMQQLG